MPDLRWLVGEPMSDEVPDSAGGAVRAFFGALGFIVALIGAEMMAEKAGDRVWIGLALIAASLPIFLSAFMWKQFRQRLGTLFADRLVAIANDPRWWIISFFLALFSMRLVMFGADFPWITAGIIVVLICLIAWGYFSTRNNQIQGRPANAASGSTLAPSKDPQIERDTLLLLDFALNHSTVKMLDALLLLAPQMRPYDRTFILRDDFEATHQACLDFVRHVGINLDRGPHRPSSFLSLI